MGKGNDAGNAGIGPEAPFDEHMPTCPSHNPCMHFNIQLICKSALQPTNASRSSLFIHILSGRSGSAHPSTERNITAYFIHNCKCMY